MDHIQNLTLIFSYATVSFLISIILAKPFTAFLYKNKIGKQIRDHAIDGKASPIFRALHLHKAGTPTMGGILIWGTVFFVFIVTLLFFVGFPELFPSDFLSGIRGQIYLPLFTLLATAVLGGIDDWFNIREIGVHKGIAARPKFLWLTVFGLLGSWWFYSKLGYSLIHVPGVGDFDIGLWYIPLFVFVIVSMANAVNITDGLDGLSSGLLVIAFGAFGLLSYIKGLVLLSIFCAAIAGALIGFLWFNIPPARFYMGDTGSLALGSTLGVIAMLTNSVLVLPIICFVFVVEIASSLIQILSKRFRNGKKVFLIAPLHHHFEKLGWPESKVVMRFWIIGGGSAVVGVILGIIGAGN